MIELYTKVSHKKDDCIGAWASVASIKEKESIRMLSGRVIHYPSNKLSYSAERLELLAILESLLSFVNSETVKITTQSQYIFSIISKMDYKEMVTKESGSIPNIDLWTLYYNLDKIHSISVKLITNNYVEISKKMEKVILEELSIAEEHKRKSRETECTKRIVIDFKKEELLSKETPKSEKLLEDLFVGNSNPFDKENIESYERQKSAIVPKSELKYDYSKIKSNKEENSSDMTKNKEFYFSPDLLPIENKPSKVDNNYRQKSNKNKKRSSKAKGYYAVARGRTVGICTSWDECKKRTEKFKGAVFKKFSTEEEALNFIKANK